MWAPIFEIRVDLAEGDLSFLPSIAMNDRQNGIRDVINEFVNDFISIAIQIPRLDTRDTGSGDYLVEIKDQFVLFGTIQDISDNMNDITKMSMKFLDQYRQWDFLWREQVDQSF